jgi:putative hydrolase of the HAD superfamily
MTPEVVLFDLDDTLIIEKASAEAAFTEVSKYTQEKYNVNPDRFQESVRKNARKLWYELPAHPYCKKIGISSWEGLWANFTGEHKMLQLLASYKDYYQFASWYNTLLEFNIDDKDFAHKISDLFRQERRKRHILFPETAGVLEHLSSGYQLGLITNGAPDLQWEKINGSGLGKYFEHIIISGEVNCGKPGKQIFKIALNKFGAWKESVIMVGDSIDTDIAGAAASGIRSVWLNRNNNIPCEHTIKPDYIIKNLKKLASLFV